MLSFISFLHMMIKIALLFVIVPMSSAFAPKYEHSTTTTSNPLFRKLQEGRARTQTPSPPLSSLPDDDDDDDDDDNNNKRNLGRELENIQSTGMMKDTIEAGDTVVCTRDLASVGIYANSGYELQSIYAQRFNTDTNQIEKIPLACLDAQAPAGYDRYITLFSPVHHDEPVVVTPEEVGLVTIRRQVFDSMWLAIPGFFWVTVCFTFYNVYHERTGGSFVDALFGRY